MTKENILVAIVEDNGELRGGLAQLIQGTPGYRCVGAFSSCEQMLGQLKSLKAHPPKVMHMDIGLPGISGIEGVKRVKAQLPATDVLMLTVFEDEKKIYDSICAGASGYLLKKTPPAKILEAIQELSDGGAPMTASIARKVLNAFQSGPPPASVDYQLTDRELDVLGWSDPVLDLPLHPPTSRVARRAIPAGAQPRLSACENQALQRLDLPCAS